MLERGREPRTLWQGFRRSSVAGTGTEKQTFFIWIQVGSRGKGTEAETNLASPEVEEQQERQELEK